jgi:hypothetical protein
MYRLIVAAALVVLVAHNPAIAGVNNHYAKWKLGQPFGYRDLKILPGRWKIRSMSFHAGMDFPVAMALHRLAVHAKANGFDRFYTVSMKVTCSNLFSGAPSGCKGTSLDEEVDIVAAGYSSSGPIPRCEETGDWAPNCKSFEVDKVLADLRAPLGLNVEQVEQEIFSARMAALKPGKSR